MNHPTGSGQPSDQEARDFIARYNQSPNSISQEEALTRYQSVAPQMSPAVHAEATQEAFARLSPQQRLALGKYLISQAQQQGAPPPDAAFPDVNGDGIDDRIQDPRYLAQVTQQAQQQRPGWLAQILGAAGGAGAASQLPSGGGFPGGTLGKVALGGVAAAALSRMLGGGGLLGGGGHGGRGFGGGGHGGHDDD